MRKLSNMLGDALGRDEIIRTAHAQRILRRWPEVVGDLLSNRSWPDRYSRGTVFVAVDGSAWAQELRMIKDTILRRLREISGDEHLFMDVRFGVRPYEKKLPYERPKERMKVNPEKRRLTIAEIREQRLKEWPSDEERA